MKQILNLVVFAAAIGMTIVSGMLYGRMSNRWGPPEQMQVAAKRLSDFPKQIGPWLQIEDVVMDDNVIEILQCANYHHARYVNQDTGQEIQVAVILGPHGPISVHTPEICFSGAGLTAMGERQKVELQGSDDAIHEFWQNGFRSRESKTEVVRVYYGWSTGSEWSATESPRWTFRGRPYLYKVQLAFTPDPSIESEESDAGLDFLAAMTEHAQAALLAQN